jgi:hypothetical protein
MDIATTSRQGRRYAITLGLGTLLLASLLLAPAPARADAWSGQKGRIFVSDTEYLGGYASDSAMIAGMKKQSKTTLKGEAGSWNLNFMVFLKEAAGGNTVNLVYYDISKKREQINYTEVGVKPEQKIVQLNGVTVSKDLGFVVGHKYEIVATRIIGGKEKVYAKTVITLK